jgi:phosphatidylglycerophosphate synthase
MVRCAGWADAANAVLDGVDGLAARRLSQVSVAGVSARIAV